jgi:hypothetical protein
MPAPPAPPPAPRAFRLGAVDSSAVFLLFFGGIWAFVGLMISVVFTVAGGPVWNDVALDRRGVVARAKPTGIRATSSQVNHRTVYEISYQFTDAEGLPRAGRSGTTDLLAITHADQGQPFDVEYDPQRPELTRLRGGRASFFGFFVLFPLAFFVVGAAVLVSGARRAVRARRLYVHGVAALATVTSVAPTSMRVNQRPVMRVDFAFDAITGRVAGHTTTREPPPVGSQLWVLHDPDDPKRSVAA